MKYCEKREGMGSSACVDPAFPSAGREEAMRTWCVTGNEVGPTGAECQMGLRMGTWVRPGFTIKRLDHFELITYLTSQTTISSFINWG